MFGELGAAIEQLTELGGQVFCGSVSKLDVNGWTEVPMLLISYFPEAYHGPEWYDIDLGGCCEVYATPLADIIRQIERGSALRATWLVLKHQSKAIN
jgi:hypothetical protein